MFSSKTVSFLVAAVTFTVSACSTPPVAGEAASTEAGEHSILGLYHAPTPVGHPRAAQREWQAAQHWERLAAAVVKGFAAARARQGGADKPVYVDPADQGMVFSKLFRSYLITHLLSNGEKISLTSAGADRVHVSVERVFHRIGQYDPPFGILSGLAAGAIAGDQYQGSFALGSIGVLTFETLMRTSYARSDPFSEVVVTVSLVRGDTVLARVTAPYYVDNQEMAQYRPSLPTLPLGVKAADGQDMSMPLRSFGVVSSAQ
jgi:hypothetical protein